MTETKFVIDVDSMHDLDVPAALRDLAEKGLARTRTNYATLKTAADEISETLSGAYSAAFKSIPTFVVNTLENGRANTDATFEHAKALLSTKTLSDAIELQMAFVRQRIEAMTVQAKEFGELTQKLAAQIAAPARSKTRKTMELQS